MKKLLFFLVLILVGLKSSGQGSDNPLLPRLFEEGYSIEQLRDSALRSTEYSQNYRKEVLKMVNRCLRNSGDYLNLNQGNPLDERHISWIYQNVFRNPNDSLPAGSGNTWKKGNLLIPFKSKVQYFGPVDYFQYGNCRQKFDKPSCGNLIVDEVMVINQTSPENLIDFSNQTKQKRDHITKLSSQQLKHDEFVDPEIIQTLAVKPIPTNYQPTDVFIPQQRNKTWVGKNLPWIIPSIVAIGTGLVVADHNDWWRAHPIVLGGQGVDPDPQGGK